MLEGVSYHGRAAAEAMVPRPDWALISISNAARGRGTEAVLQPGWPHVLRLHFDDVYTRGPQLHGFTPAHAREALDFLARVDTRVSHVAVHCDGGVSRSAGVARFIARRYGLAFDYGYPYYNTLVYETLCTVAGLQPDEDEQ